MFERETPPVAGLVAEALGRAEEPQAFGPALDSAGGDGESFEGIDGDKSETVVEGDGEGVVPAILVGTVRRFVRSAPAWLNWSDFFTDVDAEV